jgi:hypothetical protein
MPDEPPGRAAAPAVDRLAVILLIVPPLAVAGRTMIA